MPCAFAMAIGLRAADLSFVRQNIGEVDCHRLRIDGRNHLFSRLDFDQFCAGLADLVVKRISVALLDDDFVSGKIADVGNVAHAGLEVFGHHAGVADDHGRRRAPRHQSGIARGRLAQLRNKLAGCDLKLVDQNKCSLPLRISSITSGFITDPPMTVTVPLMLTRGVIPSSA